VGPAPLPPRQRPGSTHYRRPVGLWDVYADDFMGLVHKNQRRHVKLALLHALDLIMRPLDSQDSKYRQEPVSLNKMGKGDATWVTVNTVLGWILDTVAKTICLPANCLSRLRELLHSVSSVQKRISLKKWQQVLGELRSMATVIPAAIGLFSVLQEALKHKTTGGHRVRLARHTHAFLEDFRWLADDVTSRPTIISEIVPDVDPLTRGACDASTLGMGGVHFVPTKQGILPLLWRTPWPQALQYRLVSHDNPSGDVTNSEFELAASVAQMDVLAQHVDIREHIVHNLSDNSATVAWQRKGASSNVGPVAYLIRLQALHQRHHRYVPLHDFIPGTMNLMSDRASHLLHLSDTDLLLYFNSHFPQTRPWHLCQLRNKTRSTLISALSMKRSDLASLLNVPKQWTLIGDGGEILFGQQH
jgi:hypothetical protein